MNSIIRTFVLLLLMFQLSFSTTLRKRFRGGGPLVKTRAHAESLVEDRVIGVKYAKGTITPNYFAMHSQDYSRTTSSPRATEERKIEPWLIALLCGIGLVLAAVFICGICVKMNKKFTSWISKMKTKRAGYMPLKRENQKKSRRGTENTKSKDGEFEDHLTSIAGPSNSKQGEKTGVVKETTTAGSRRNSCSNENTSGRVSGNETHNAAESLAPGDRQLLASFGDEDARSNANRDSVAIEIHSQDSTLHDHDAKSDSKTLARIYAGVQNSVTYDSDVSDMEHEVSSSQTNINLLQRFFNRLKASFMALVSLQPKETAEDKESLIRKESSDEIVIFHKPLHPRIANDCKGEQEPVQINAREIGLYQKINRTGLAIPANNLDNGAVCGNLSNVKVTLNEPSALTARKEDKTGEDRANQQTQFSSKAPNLKITREQPPLWKRDSIIEMKDMIDFNDNMSHIVDIGNNLDMNKPSTDGIENESCDSKEGLNSIRVKTASSDNAMPETRGSLSMQSTAAGLSQHQQYQAAQKDPGFGYLLRQYSKADTHMKDLASAGSPVRRKKKKKKRVRPEKKPNTYVPEDETSIYGGMNGEESTAKEPEVVMTRLYMSKDGSMWIQDEFNADADKISFLNVAAAYGEIPDRNLTDNSQRQAGTGPDYRRENCIGEKMDGETQKRSVRHRATRMPANLYIDEDESSDGSGIYEQINLSASTMSDTIEWTNQQGLKDGAVYIDMPELEGSSDESSSSEEASLSSPDSLSRRCSPIHADTATASEGQLDLRDETLYIDMPALESSSDEGSLFEVTKGSAGNFSRTCSSFHAAVDVSSVEDVFNEVESAEFVIARQVTAKESSSKTHNYLSIDKPNCSLLQTPNQLHWKSRLARVMSDSGINIRGNDLKGRIGSEETNNQNSSMLDSSAGVGAGKEVKTCVSNKSIQTDDPKRSSKKRWKFMRGVFKKKNRRTQGPPV